MRGSSPIEPIEPKGAIRNSAGLVRFCGQQLPLELLASPYGQQRVAKRCNGEYTLVHGFQITRWRALFLTQRHLKIGRREPLTNFQVHRRFYFDIMFRKVSKMFGGGESPAGKSESVQQVLGQRCVDLLTASVVSIESVDDASGKYDAFVIVVKCSSKEYRIRKRYSEFEAFRNLCMSEIPDVYFPGKKFNLLQMNAEKLERRRGKLDKFLKAVLSCKTMTMVLQCDVLSFLEAFVNLSIDPGTPLFTYEAVSSTEFALKSSGQVSVAVVSVAKDIKADIVLYDVDIIIAEQTKYRVQHRFSAFQELHEKFKSVMPNLYFPGTLILLVDAQKQESRRVKLDVWLRTVMSASALPADLQRELLRFLDLFNKSGLHPQVRPHVTHALFQSDSATYRRYSGPFLPVASKWSPLLKRIMSELLSAGRVCWIVTRHRPS